MEFAYPVYSNTDPSVVIEQNKNPTKLGEYQFKKFGNVYIGNLPPENLDLFTKTLDGSVLFIGTPKAKEGLSNSETISGTDGLAILTIKKISR